MKIETAIEKGFVKSERGWRKKIFQKQKDGISRFTWQHYLSKVCEKCGVEFIASHKATRFCNSSCAMSGNEHSLGVTYKRKNRPEKIIQHGYYWIIREGHPNAIKDRIPLHRDIMEKFLSRYLNSNEHIHHINGDKLDNRIENLIVLTRSEHNSIHKSEEVKLSQRDGNGQFIE